VLLKRKYNPETLFIHPPDDKKERAFAGTV
jgi:hypothetical protein